MSEKYKPHTLAGDRSPEKPELLTVTPPDLDAETVGDISKLRELISEIDETILREIFFEELARCGVDTSESSFIPLADVVFDSRYEGEPNTSALHITRTLEKSHRIIIVPDQNTPPSFAKVLWSIIHEQLHGVSTTIAVHSGPWNTTVKSRSGVSNKVVTEQVLSDEVIIEEHHLNFNEGLTELISERIFVEYCRQAGIGSHLEQVQQKYRGEFAYGLYRQKVDYFIGLIQILSGVDRVTVENALIRTYFRNGEILPEEFRQLIDERKPGVTDKLIGYFNDTHMATTSLLLLDIAVRGLDFLEPQEKLPLHDVLVTIRKRDIESQSISSDNN